MVCEERCEQRRCGVAGGVFDWLPEERHPTGEVADGEQVGEAPVDERGSFGEVDGPDAAGFGPMQDPQRDAMTFTPDAAVAAEEIGLLGTQHIGEALSQRGKSDAGAVLFEDV